MKNQLFISYTDADVGWVERQLIPALTAAGLECHHEALFSLGKPRLLEFEEAIKQSDRILLICSPAYFADESLQIVDLLAARHGEEAKSWPVIPIIRHAVELPLRLRILGSLDATDQASWPDALARLSKELKVDTPQEPKSPRCPYPGMKPFERDSEFPFYGRQEEVGEIIERLRLHPFLAVIGASGSGKSSLVHAGLIPELNRSQLLGEGDWLTSSFRPSEGNHDQTIVSRLEAHLGGQVGDPESAKASVDSLLQVAREASQPNAQQLLLVVDQFEEVYTLQNERDEKYRLNKDDADQFQRALLTLADVPGCYVVLTVRADFFGDLMESPIWDKGVKDHRFELTTLGDEGMRQAIVQPALDQDVCIDQVLVERLLSETGSEPGILPFLQETLVLLWGKLRWRYLSALDYESMVRGRRAEFRSGLEVAMAQRADAAISSLPDEEHRLVARRILLRLVQFGEGRLHTRRQQTVAQLSSAHSDEDIFDVTLIHLTEKRLLTIGDPRAGRGASNDTGKEGKVNFGSDQRSVDIAHDKLITGWPALSDDEKGWIVMRRQAEETRRDLEAKVKRWVDLGRKRFGGGLLDKIELAECDNWIQSNDAAEIGEVPELDQLQKVSQQRLWFRRAGVIAIPVLMIVAMGFWIWGVYGIAAEETAKREQETKRADAEKRERETAERLVRVERENATALEQQLAIANANRLVAEESALPRRNAELNGLLLAESIRLSEARNLPPNPVAHQRIRDWLLQRGGHSVRGLSNGWSRQWGAVPNSFGAYQLTSTDGVLQLIECGSREDARWSCVLGKYGEYGGYSRLIGFTEGKRWLLMSNSFSSADSANSYKRDHQIDVLEISKQESRARLVKAIPISAGVGSVIYHRLRDCDRFIVFTSGYPSGPGVDLEQVIVIDINESGDVHSELLCTTAAQYGDVNRRARDNKRTRLTRDKRYLLTVDAEKCGIVDLTSEHPKVQPIAHQDIALSDLARASLNYWNGSKNSLAISLDYPEFKIMILNLSSNTFEETIDCPTIGSRTVSPQNLLRFDDGCLIVTSDAVVATKDFEKYAKQRTVVQAFSPNRQSLVTVDATKPYQLVVRLWNEDSFRNAVPMATEAAAFSTLIFTLQHSADRIQADSLVLDVGINIIVLGFKNQLAVYRRGNGNIQRLLLAPSESIKNVALSDDNRWIAIETNELLQRIALDRSNLVAESLGPASGGVMEFSDIGRWLRYGSRVWDMQESFTPWINQDRKVETDLRGVGRSNNGKYFVTHKYDELRFCIAGVGDSHSARKVIKYAGYSDERFTVSNDGTYCVANEKGDLISEFGDVNEIPLGRVRSWEYKFSPNSRWLVALTESGTGGDAIQGGKLWDVRSMLASEWNLPDLTASKEFRVGYTREYPLSFSPRGDLLAIGTGGTIALTDLEHPDDAPRTKLLDGTGVVTACSFLTDQHIIVATFDKKMRQGRLLVLDKALEMLDEGFTLTQPVGSLSVNSLGNWIACVSPWGGQGMHLANWDHGELTIKKLPYGSFTCVNFSPDGRWFAGGTHEGHVELIDLSGSFDERIRFIQEPSELRSMAFSPDGKWLLTTDDGRRRSGARHMKMWDLRTRDPAIAPVKIRIADVFWTEPECRWVFTVHDGCLARHPLRVRSLLQDVGNEVERDFSKEERRIHQITK